MSKLYDIWGSNLSSFLSTDLKFVSFTAKYLKFKTLWAFFEILKTFQVITIKIRCFRLRKCYSGICKIEAKRLLKKTLIRFWTSISVKYENIILVPSNATPLTCNSRKRTLRLSFSLFIWNYQTKFKVRVREFNKLFSDI